METTDERFETSIQPSFVADVERWSIEGTNVRCDGAVRLDLAEITGGTWTERRSTRAVAAHLTVESTGSRRHSVSCASQGMTTDQVEFHRFCSTLLARVGQIRPDAKIHMQGGSSDVLLGFIPSLLSTIAGLLLLLDSFETIDLLKTATTRGAVVIGLFGAVLLVGGALRAWAHRPWPTSRFLLPATDASNALGERIDAGVSRRWHRR